MGFQSFATGMFTAADLQGLRELAGKPEALFAIGQHLRQVRKEAKLTRVTVAARCGINLERLGRFEHGASGLDFQSFEKLCDLLGVDVEPLLCQHMRMSPATAATLIQLACRWSGGGKPLSVEDLLDMPDPKAGKNAPDTDAR